MSTTSSVTYLSKKRQNKKENAFDLTPHIIQAFLIVFKDDCQTLSDFIIHRELSTHFENNFYSYKYYIYVDDCECLVLTVGDHQTLVLNEFKMGMEPEGTPCCKLPTQQLLDVVTLVALFSDLNKILIADDSRIIINQSCDYSLAFFYLLETGNSWYDNHGFLSKDWKGEYNYNMKLLDKPLSFFHNVQQPFILQIIHILITQYNDHFPYDTMDQVLREMTLRELMENYIVKHKHKITKCTDPMFKIIVLLESTFMFEDVKSEAIKNKVFYYDFEERFKDVKNTVMPSTLEEYMRGENLSIEEIKNTIGAISQFLISTGENITTYNRIDHWTADAEIDCEEIIKFIREYRTTHFADNGVAMELDLDEYVEHQSPIVQPLEKQDKILGLMRQNTALPDTTLIDSQKLRGGKLKKKKSKSSKHVNRIYRKRKTLRRLK